MKLIHKSINFSPIRLSLTYINNENQISQVAFNEDKLNSYLKEVNSPYLTPNEFINAVISEEKVFKDLILYFEKPNLTKIAEKIEENSAIKVGEVDKTLQKLLLEMLNDPETEERKLLAWSKFAKRLQKNVDPYIQSQLFRFLEKLIEEGSIAITDEGSILGYKGLDSKGNSIHIGSAYVDGELYEQTCIPNLLGSVISMPRNEVEANPDSSCSYGLHVGSYCYANSFGNKLVIVEVAPEDVVSIPKDSASRKMRCCKYKVISEDGKLLKNIIYSLSDFEISKDENNVSVDNKNIANNLSDEDFLKELGEESSSPKENKTLSELSDEDFLKSLGEKSSLESLSDEDFLSQLEENIPVNKLSDEDFFANL